MRFSLLPRFLVGKMSNSHRPISKRFLLLTVLVLQNSLTALLGRFTRVSLPKEDLYDINQFVLVSEVLKLAVCFLLEAATQKGSLLKHFRLQIAEQPLEVLKMAVPAALYWGSNTLQYVSISNLPVPIFQIASQGKLVTTAIVSVCMLGRSYSSRQWACLLIISASVATIAFEESNSNSLDRAQAPISDKDSSSLIIGVFSILLASMLSAFAGVYFESVLKIGISSEPLLYKRSQTISVTPSLWMRNIQLSFFSILVAYLQMLGRDKTALFHGFSPAVWCQIVLFAGGGLLVAAVIKHSDNVMKSLATGLSVLITTAGSMILYNTPLTPTFSFCAAATVAATYYFSNDVPVFQTKGFKWAACLCLLLSINVHSSFLALPNRTLADNQDDMIAVVQSGKYDLASTSILPNQTDLYLQKELFFSDWNTTKDALIALRSIRAKVQERGFHEATHVLYDLRTMLGNRPVKYLEIGSYTGISASLILSHPMPTFATLVDPCVLPKEHYNGTYDQEATIRKNLALVFPRNRDCSIQRPWELRVGFSPQALPKTDSFDIIFIDGDHSTRGVWADYQNTIDLLRPGGFMVFDDYLDARYSPEVRGAVDDIARRTELVAIGTPKNIHGIHPEVSTRFINAFVFQKKGTFAYSPQHESQIKARPLLCVSVATYRRANGTTPAKLEELWKMLKRQSYTGWTLYLTGDHYDNETEWSSLSFFSDPQARIHNLPEPGERGKFSNQRELWLNAGATAMNDSIDRILADGHEWVVRLDDDDFWDPDHLQNIVDGIRTGATFVMTECQYKSSSSLPLYPGKSDVSISHEILPRPCNLIHSSVAFNAAKLSSRYKAFPDTPADAYMWARIVFDDSFFPAFVPVVSCYHLEEQGRKGINRIVRKSVLRDRNPPLDGTVKTLAFMAIDR